MRTNYKEFVDKISEENAGVLDISDSEIETLLQFKRSATVESQNYQLARPCLKKFVKRVINETFDNKGPQHSSPDCQKNTIMKTHNSLKMVVDSKKNDHRRFTA
mmetsp:Transcript_30581/g.46899  ORF Transcript_30581/g.46899 Transcript_30581/m.46899 type:complete len:104 (+) Transcript_30581:816-1127(+)